MERMEQKSQPGGEAMLCQYCSEEATVHLTKLHNGKPREFHFCTECARKKGLAVDGVIEELGAAIFEAVEASRQERENEDMDDNDIDSDNDHENDSDNDTHTISLSEIKGLSPANLMELIESVVQFVVQGQLGEKSSAVARASCPICGLRFMDFRDTGRLGCPHDYDALSEGLLPLIERNQGTTRHVGKSPRRFASALMERDLERLRTRGRLRVAVEREDYEEAARLRDELRRKEAAE